MTIVFDEKYYILKVEPTFRNCFFDGAIGQQNTILVESTGCAFKV